MLHQRREQPAVGNDYYGFREAPFSLTPDPKFAYPSESQERALRTILHALSRHEGLLIVTGDIGCGKTTLCRRLLPLLPERTFLSLVLNPFLTADDLLKQVLEDYGVVSADDSRRGLLARASCHELARTLQEFLNSLSQIDGTAVIIVDEAQNLPLRTLEQIRLLSNFETDTRKLLQIILVGQRELEPILELDELRQLTQRVSRRLRVEPLAPAEVAAYVDHRLRVALPVNEQPPVRFTPRAFKALSGLSRGVPRIINLLCDRAIEHAYAQGTITIDRRGVLTAADDLNLPVPLSSRILPDISRRAAFRGAAAAALIAAITVGAFAIRRGLPAWSTPLLSEARDDSPEAVSSAAKPTLQLEPALEAKPAAEPPSIPASQPARMRVPPTAILESAPSYELTVASFETASRATAVAADLVAHGHPARVAVSNSGRWQMVLVGPYTSLEEATGAKTTLEQEGFSAIRIARQK